PGGPAPVLKELALKFEEKTKEKVIVTAGPTPAWVDKAKENADLIFSGNTSMMDDFANLHFYQDLKNLLLNFHALILKVRQKFLLLKLHPHLWYIEPNE
ncbi:substrate-binding domain-containing protein, partial [Campylobacter jejuni]|uniref:substrate-binding domain-containing protein n=1 Tax=Campylobacter jejuni TaxID=197 RepID=UPI000D5839CE